MSRLASGKEPGRGAGAAGGRQVVSAPERTDGPGLPAPGLRFGKAAVLRLREDPRTRPPIGGGEPGRAQGPPGVAGDGRSLRLSPALQG